MSLAGLLLAAGQSTRFGSENKLTALVNGKPLVTYAADAMRRAGFDSLIAVVSDKDVAELLDGFQICTLTDGPAAQSRSLAMGVAAAKEATRLTVVLGDMPKVSSALIRQVTDLCPPGGASACTDGERRLPPAAFDAALFDRLKALTGDRGAGDLLREISDDRILFAARQVLVDIDTPEDLAALSR